MKTAPLPTSSLVRPLKKVLRQERKRFEPLSKRLKSNDERGEGKIKVRPKRLGPKRFLRVAGRGPNQPDWRVGGPGEPGLEVSWKFKDVSDQQG